MKLENKTITTADINRALTLLPNPSQILKDKGATIDIFHRIAKQPDIFSVSQNYKDALSAMSLSVNDTFFEEYFNQINKYALIRNASSARDYGYAVLEITEYGDFMGKTVPIKIELCPPEKFKFDKDRKLRLIQQGTPDGIILNEKYPNKFIILQNEPTLSNPYGTALLDVSYWLGVGLNGNFEFMLEFAEEDGRDKWIGTYQPNATEEEKNELSAALSTLVANAVAIKPEGMNIEPKQLAGRSATADLYKSINEILLRKVEKLWYGTDLTMQVQGKGGYSSSQSGIDIREDALAQGRLLAIDAATQLINIVANINNIKTDKILVSMFSDRQTSKEEAETDQIYFNMGMKPTAKFFENRGYNPDEFTLENVIPSSTSVIPSTAKNLNQNAQFSNVILSDSEGTKQNAQFSDTNNPQDILGIFELFKQDLKQGK